MKTTTEKYVEKLKELVELLKRYSDYLNKAVIINDLMANITAGARASYQSEISDIESSISSLEQQIEDGEYKDMYGRPCKPPATITTNHIEIENGEGGLRDELIKFADHICKIYDDIPNEQIVDEYLKSK